MAEIVSGGGRTLEVPDSWIDELIAQGDAVITEYKGLQIKLPPDIQDMMLCCDADSVKSFNYAFCKFAQSIIDSTRKKFKVSTQNGTRSD